MPLRLSANRVSAAGLTCFTRSSRSSRTTAVASQSKPEKAAGFMRPEKRHRGPGALHPGHVARRKCDPCPPSGRLGSGKQSETPLPEATEFALQLLDVLGVLAD